jgi:hypothetical protein
MRTPYLRGSRRPTLLGVVALAATAGWMLACGRGGEPEEQVTAQCTADLVAAIGLIERNYAGYRDKLERIGADTFAAAREAALRSAALAGPQSCRTLIAEWLSGFGDGHLSIAEAKPQAPAASPAPVTSPAASPTSAPVAAGGNASEPVADRRAPAVELLTESAALLRVPSFSARYEASVEQLVAEHRDEIAARPQLILDLRGNSGGSDATYDVLAELVYTDPVLEIGADLLASPENIALWEELLPTVPPGGVRDEISETLERLRAQPGGWVSTGEDQTLAIGA